MTPGKKFFQEHMEYVARKDFAGMVNDTYTEDVIFYHNFPFFPGNPPYIFRGKEETIRAESTIFDPKNQGQISAGEPFNFVENKDFIGFQIIVTSPNTGKWLITDAWVLRNGKIAVYYAMGYKLEEAPKQKG